MLLNSLEEFLYLMPVILLSLSFHEFAHAYVSDKLGDPTPRMMGRLTLNPAKHLDPIGTIMMIFAQFGWAKPVPINPAYYRDGRKGTMLVSVAGPLSNVILAFIFAFPMVYIKHLYAFAGMEQKGLMPIIYNFLVLFFIININLAVFNIIPVPPLDGSKILSGILPGRTYFKFMEYQNYISIAFLIIIFVRPGILTLIMSPFTWAIQTGILSVVEPIIKALL